MSDFYTVIMRLLLAHSWFKIMDFSQFFYNHFTSWYLKTAVKPKWSNFSKKETIFLNYFCWINFGVFLRSLARYQILQELINLRLKCSLVQIWSKSPQEFKLPDFMVCFLLHFLSQVFSNQSNVSSNYSNK